MRVVGTVSAMGKTTDGLIELANQVSAEPAGREMDALVAELVQRDRRIPWVRMLRGHNHVSPAMQINSEVDTLGPELLEFVKECSA